MSLLSAVSAVTLAASVYAATDSNGAGEERTPSTQTATGVSIEAAAESAVNKADPSAMVSHEKQVNGPDMRDWQPPPMPAKTSLQSLVDPAQEKLLAEKWGVKLISLNLTAASYMMDFRFRVLDVDKALPLFDHRIKPVLVVERSGAELPVPMATKVGAFRPSNRGKNIKADKNYYMVFGNPDQHVKSGEKVNLVIGDFLAENITVN